MDHLRKSKELMAFPLSLASCSVPLGNKPTRATETMTDQHPCQWEAHGTCNEVPPPSAATPWMEKAAVNEVIAEAIEEKKTRDDEGKVPVEAVENQDKGETVEEHVRQQEEDVPLPTLCRFETQEDEGQYEWQPHCKRTRCTSNDAPPPSAAATQQEEDVTLPAPLSRSSDSAKKNLKRFYNAASNCVEVVWTIPEKQLSKTNKTLISEDFEIWERGTFKLILRACPHNMKGGFHESKGVGMVELKFCGGTEFAGKIHWRVAAGQNQELPFQGLDHDFATRSQSTLQQEWNLLSAVNQGSLLLHFEARMQE